MDSGSVVGVGRTQLEPSVRVNRRRRLGMVRHGWSSLTLCVNTYTVGLGRILLSSSAVLSHLFRSHAHIQHRLRRSGIPPCSLCSQHGEDDERAGLSADSRSCHVYPQPEAAASARPRRTPQRGLYSLPRMFYIFHLAAEPY